MWKLVSGNDRPRFLALLPDDGSPRTYVLRTHDCSDTGSGSGSRTRRYSPIHVLPNLQNVQPNPLPDRFRMKQRKCVSIHQVMTAALDRSRLCPTGTSRETERGRLDTGARRLEVDTGLTWHRQCPSARPRGLPRKPPAVLDAEKDMGGLAAPGDEDRSRLCRLLCPGGPVGFVASGRRRPPPRSFPQRMRTPVPVAGRK